MSTVDKAGEDRVGAGDRGLQRRRVRGRQVGGDDTYRFSRQLVRVSDDGGDVVAGGDGLLEGLPSDPAGRGEDRDLHLVLPAFSFRKASAWSATHSA
jgi:hypothetical protein